MSSLKAKRIDTLILGCTHYPLLKDVIRRVMGSDVVLVDSAKEVAKEARGILDASGLLNASARGRKYKFFVSDEPDRFVKMGKRFLKRRMSCVKRAV